MTSGPDYGQELPRTPSAYGRSAAVRVPAPVDHRGANAALVLGIVSVISWLLSFLCLVTAPGVLCAPAAWAIGANAINEIDHSLPGRYGNRSSAVRGLRLGIAMTVIGALSALVLLVLFVLFVGHFETLDEGYSSQPTRTGSLTSRMP
jgi:hypothetical protein